MPLTIFLELKALDYMEEKHDDGGQVSSASGRTVEQPLQVQASGSPGLSPQSGSGMVVGKEPPKAVSKATSIEMAFALLEAEIRLSRRRHNQAVNLLNQANRALEQKHYEESWRLWKAYLKLVET